MIDMELQEINPYVRISVCTPTHPDWRLTDRIIYDHQFVLISHGKGIVRIREKEYHASKGDLFLIKPGLVHGFIADREAPFEMLVTHFDFFYERERNFWPHKKYHLEEGEAPDHIPDQELIRDVPVFDRNMIFPDYIRLQNYISVEVLMKKLIDLNGSLMPGKELMAKSCFFELLYVVYTEAVRGRDGSGQLEEFEKIKKAFSCMNERFMENLKIGQLASLCNLSTNYFSALFKKQTTYSPKEYIIRLRIEKAKALLTESALAVNEISEQVGFHDLHYFSFYFKKYEGISPSQYRSMVRGDD